VVAVASISTCGLGTPLSVCLDYPPNPNHVPLYADDVRLEDPAVWERVQRFLVDAGLVGSAVPFESLVVTDLAPLTNP
jgi:hypothetical protein